MRGTRMRNQSIKQYVEEARLAQGLPVDLTDSEETEVRRILARVFGAQA